MARVIEGFRAAFEEFAGRSSGRSPTHVWYAAYGSNMQMERLACYLRGGTPPGGSRAHPGCRDPRPPLRSWPVTLRGTVYFATESAVWTGGRAFYDPDAAGEAPARAHLLTVSQFGDIAAQEMGRDPAGDGPGPEPGPVPGAEPGAAELDLSAVLRTGRLRLGPGRYETLVCAGRLDGWPVLTFTAPWSSGEIPCNVPSAAYLRCLGQGLHESHGWSAERVARYLASRPGVRGSEWTEAAIKDLLHRA